MSQGAPTGLDGQIESPNPFELFWDKNKRLVIALGVILVAAVAAKYGVQYLDEVEKNTKWSAVADLTGLSHAYTDLPPAPDPTPMGEQLYFLKRIGVVTDLEQGIETVDVAELRSQLADVAGDRTREPLLLWTLAIRHVIDEEYDDAVTRLEELKSKYPQHPFCKDSPFPPQSRDRVENEDDDEPVRPSDLEFEPAVPGNLVDRLVSAIHAEKAFIAANPRFFQPVAMPEATKHVEIQFGEDEADRFYGKVKIALFEDAAPEHVARFVELVEDGFFDGLRVHYVERGGIDAAAVDERLLPSELRFGLSVTRDEDNRENWTVPPGKGEHEVDWEQNDLSHFPGMVAALRAEGRPNSIINRIAINGRDTAGTKDGSRVIFGQVVEGLDVIQQIIEDVDFQSEADVQVGNGEPAEDIRVTARVL